MTRVMILVEGQTEETFVNEILAPLFQDRKIYLTATQITTSTQRSAGTVHKGGIPSYQKVKNEILKLLNNFDYVSTMFDFYALPSDFYKTYKNEYESQNSGLDKVNLIEHKMQEDINQNHFIANIMLHEFEALLFSDTQKFLNWFQDEDALQRLCLTIPPEEINQHPSTSPSKRILDAFPNYDKVIHGFCIADDIGLDVIRAHCPHFNDWLNKLENLN